MQTKLDLRSGSSRRRVAKGPDHKRFQSHLILGFVWFLTALTPTLGLVPIGDVWRAERFLYPALPGFIIMGIFFLERIPFRIVLPVTLLVLLGFLIQSSFYLRQWQSSRELFQNAFELEPTANHVVAAKQGYFSAKKNDFPTATEWFRKALQIQPRNADALEGLAVAKAPLQDQASQRLTNRKFVLPLLDGTSLPRLKQLAANLILKLWLTPPHHS